MRRFLLPLLLLFTACLTVPQAAPAKPLNVITATQLSKVCPANGTTDPAVTLTLGVTSWLLTVHVNEIFVCRAATCASGGVRLVAGSQIEFDFHGTSAVSCRSTTGDGEMNLNPTVQ